MALSLRDITVGGGWNSLLDVERLFRAVPPSAVSFLGSSRRFRCCPELELADGRRITSCRGSATVRVDDVPVCEAWTARVGRKNRVTGPDVAVSVLNIVKSATIAVGALIAAPTRDLAFELSGRKGDRQ